MTLTIDDSLEITKLLVTSSEVNPVTSGSTLHLFSPSTNVSSVFELPDDSSTATTRYNLFVLPTSTFSGLTIGKYNFEVKDSNSGTTESGILNVVRAITTAAEDIESQYVFIKPSPIDDDYVVYKSNP